MKITLTKSMFASEFYKVRPDQFTYNALCSLFDYYEEIEQGSDEEMEFDAVAICCDWTEYETAIEAAEAYGWEPDADEDEDTNEESALDYLREDTQVIEVGDSYLVLNR